MAVSMKRLQRADRLLGGPAFLLLAAMRRWRRSPARAPAGTRRVLLIKFWGLGSLQLLTPSMRALRRAHPGASLELLTLRENRAVAEGLGVFDRVEILDVSTGWRLLVLRILRLLRRVRSRRYDAVYDFEFFTRFSAVVSFATGAAESHGFALPGSLRARLHTNPICFRREWHVARNFRALAGGEDGLEIQNEDLVRFRVAARDRAEAAALLFSNGFEGGPLVVLNPNAGALSLERRWPPERFASLARRLITEEDARVVLVGSAQERGWTRTVANHVGPVPSGRLADAAGRLSVGALAALLESASVFVTNDSGPMHLAAALGVPTLGLFGPETPEMYRPLGPRARYLYRPTPCSPCINVHRNKLAICVRGRAECLTAIGVDEVFFAARQELRLRRPCAFSS